MLEYLVTKLECWYEAMPENVPLLCQPSNVGVLGNETRVLV
jgi:hypothetical protein